MQAQIRGVSLPEESPEAGYVTNTGSRQCSAFVNLSSFYINLL